MRITINTDGLQRLRDALMAARDAVMPAVADAVEATCEQVQNGLSSAAPRGTGDDAAEPPPGDAAGHLADSFSYALEAEEVMVTGTVSTSQPQKLAFVVEGRGEVFPVTKKALFWPGLAHPVRHAAASVANDFVSPVVDEAIGGLPEQFDAALSQVQVAMDGV
ncbi:MAG TPA: hypothetical protein VFA10_17775 [Ktedonobacteraceae bacterium]|nr:hypothetical protein [Ktedonobacteraceae bacterium]